MRNLLLSSSSMVAMTITCTWSTVYLPTVRNPICLPTLKFKILATCMYTTLKVFVNSWALFITSMHCICYKLQSWLVCRPCDEWFQKWKVKNFLHKLHIIFNWVLHIHNELAASHIPTLWANGWQVSSDLRTGFVFSDLLGQQEYLVGNAFRCRTYSYREIGELQLGPGIQQWSDTGY